MMVEESVTSVESLRVVGMQSISCQDFPRSRDDPSKAMLSSLSLTASCRLVELTESTANSIDLIYPVLSSLSPSVTL